MGSPYDIHPACWGTKHSSPWPAMAHRATGPSGCHTHLSHQCDRLGRGEFPGLGKRSQKRCVLTRYNDIIISYNILIWYLYWCIMISYRSIDMICSTTAYIYIYMHNYIDRQQISWFSSGCRSCCSHMNTHAVGPWVNGCFWCISFQLFLARSSLSSYFFTWDLRIVDNIMDS